MSKFDYDCFCGDDDSLGFNASKYNKEEALKIGFAMYLKEIALKHGECIKNRRWG